MIPQQNATEYLNSLRPGNEKYWCVIDSIIQKLENASPEKLQRISKEYNITDQASLEKYLKHRVFKFEPLNEIIRWGLDDGVAHVHFIPAKFSITRDIVKLYKEKLHDAFEIIAQKYKQGITGKDLYNAKISNPEKAYDTKPISKITATSLLLNLSMIQNMFKQEGFSFSHACAHEKLRRDITESDLLLIAEIPITRLLEKLNDPGIELQ